MFESVLIKLLPVWRRQSILKETENNIKEISKEIEEISNSKDNFYKLDYQNRKKAYKSLKKSEYYFNKLCKRYKKMGGKKYFLYPVEIPFLRLDEFIEKCSKCGTKHIYKADDILEGRKERVYKNKYSELKMLRSYVKVVICKSCGNKNIINELYCED